MTVSINSALQIVSCGMDKTVIVWDVGTGAALRKYRGHAGTVNCVRFNEDSTIAISGSVDGTVKCWDAKSKRQEPVQTLEECKDSVTSVDISDHEILVGCADCRRVFESGNWWNFTFFGKDLGTSFLFAGFVDTISATAIS